MEEIKYISDESFFTFRKISGREEYRVKAHKDVSLPDSLEIPAYYKGLPVTAISDCGFEFSEIVNIKIPNTVTHIGKAAFSECEKLESAILSEKLDDIPDHLFYNCGKLRYVAMPKTTESIGEGAFDLCSSLLEIKIPYGVKSIWDEAFFLCSRIRSIELPETLEHIGDSAFGFCLSLSEVINRSSLDITAGERYGGGVGRYAVEIHTGESRIKTQGDFLFYEAERGAFLIGYLGEDEKITLPEDYRGNAYAVHRYAFHGKNIESAVIPDSVTEIGEGAFYSCPKLCEVTLPQTLKEISASLFSGCWALESISIPAGVTLIGNFAFGGCRKLSEISIPAGVKKIGKGAFSKTDIEKMILPEGIDEIDNMVFEQCKKLKSLTIPNGVKYIGAGAFLHCYKLNEIIFRGTMAEWNALETEWNTQTYSGRVRVVCRDGEITIDRRFA